MSRAELTAVNNRAAAFSRDLPWRAQAAALDIHALLNDSKPRCFTGKNPGLWSIKWTARYKREREAYTPQREIIPWSIDAFFDSDLDPAPLANYLIWKDGIIYTKKRAPGAAEHKDSNNPMDWRARLVARYKKYQGLAGAGKRAGIARWKEFSRGPRSFPFDRFPNQGGHAQSNSEIVETLVPYWKRLFHWCRKFRKWQWENGHRWDSRYIAKPGKWMYEDLRTEGEQVRASIPHHRGATIMGEKKGTGGKPPKVTRFEWAIDWFEVEKWVISVFFRPHSRMYRRADKGITEVRLIEPIESEWCRKIWLLAAYTPKMHKLVELDIRRPELTETEKAAVMGITDRTLRNWRRIMDFEKIRLIGEHYGNKKGTSRIFWDLRKGVRSVQDDAGSTSASA